MRLKREQVQFSSCSYVQPSLVSHAETAMVNFPGHLCVGMCMSCCVEAQMLVGLIPVVMSPSKQSDKVVSMHCQATAVFAVIAMCCYFCTCVSRTSCMLVFMSCTSCML